MTPEAHHVVVVVGTPEVRAVAGTEVGFVTFWLMDPLPVEVTPEVDVERAQTAALVWTTEDTQGQTYAIGISDHILLLMVNAGSWEH